MPLPSLNFSTLNNAVAGIRKARIGDVPAIYRIEVQSFKDPYSPLLLMNLLALYPYGVFVAESEWGVVGYMIIRIIAQKGHIIALAVDKRHRNNSIGTQMLNKAVEVFKERGVDGAWLEVRASNLHAQRFYLGRGFMRIIQVEEYYGDGEDAEILYMPLLS